VLLSHDEKDLRENAWIFEGQPKFLDGQDK